MKRYPSSVVITAGTENWTDSTGEVWTTDEPVNWTFDTSVRAFPIALTIPITTNQLTVPKRRAYSAATTISLVSADNWTLDDATEWTTSDSDPWIYNAAITQSATPIVLTIPASDADLVIGE